MRALIATPQLDVIASIGVSRETGEALSKLRYVVVNLLIPEPMDQLPLVGVADVAATGRLNQVGFAVEPVRTHRGAGVDQLWYLMLVIAGDDVPGAVDLLLRCGLQNRGDDVFEFRRLRGEIAIELAAHLRQVRP